MTGGITTGVTGGIDSLGTALNPSAMLEQAGTFGKAFLENPITAYTGGTYLPKGNSIFPSGKASSDVLGPVQGPFGVILQIFQKDPFLP